ncbi:MAG: Hsp33 family molecular chaperone HslO [Lactobacillus sp.]|nr:Hsp33 family molecular chaperone HslO [Lactobacillus sp.]
MKNFDTCTAFHTNNGAFLGRLVRLDDVINTIIGKHQYPKDASAVLAESIALSALFSSYLKYEGLFTLQIQTDGAVSLVVVDVTSEGLIRGYARYDENKIEKIRNPNEKYRIQDDEILEAPHYLGGGQLAFTIDQGPDTELYQGIVELKGNTLSEVASKYFEQSEQIETFLQLYLQAPQNEDDNWKAAGLMLQKLPSHGGKEVKSEELDKAWEEAVVFAQSLKKEEIFDNSLSAKDLLNRLYHASDLVITKSKEYNFGCRCSRDKVLSTIRSFPPEEVEALQEQNKITVDCNFCSEKYVFDKGEFSTH